LNDITIVLYETAKPRAKLGAGFLSPLLLFFILEARLCCHFAAARDGVKVHLSKGTIARIFVYS